MATPTAITRFTPVFKPLTNITPFTFRDGYTFLEMYEALRSYLSDTLSPDIDAKLTLIYDEVQTQIVDLAADVNASKDAWQALFDEFMANVIVELEALNDQAVANLVNDAASQISAALDKKYLKRNNVFFYPEDYWNAEVEPVNYGHTFNRVIEAAQGQPIILQSGKTYPTVTAIVLGTASAVDLRTSGAAPATIHHPGQSLSSIIHFQPGGGVDQDHGGTVAAETVLTESVGIDANGWLVANPVGVVPGMICEVISSKLWYHDPRPGIGEARKSELHKVARVEGSRVYMEAPAQDGYSTAAETVTLKFFNPISVSMNNIKVTAVMPTFAESTSASIGIRIDHAMSPRLKDVSAEHCARTGVYLAAAYDGLIDGGYSKASNNFFNGYGVSVSGSSFTRVTNRTITESRRGVDFSTTRSGVVSRNCVVDNSRCMGGGKNSRGEYYGWTPTGDIAAYQGGFGSHAGVDNITYRDNETYDMHAPFTIRGRNTQVLGNTHYGRSEGGVVWASDGVNIDIDGNRVLSNYWGMKDRDPYNKNAANPIDRYRSDYLLTMYASWQSNPEIGTTRGQLRIANNNIEVRSGLFRMALFHKGETVIKDNTVMVAHPTVGLVRDMFSLTEPATVADVSVGIMRLWWIGGNVFRAPNEPTIIKLANFSLEGANMLDYQENGMADVLQHGFTSSVEGPHAAGAVVRVLVNFPVPFTTTPTVTITSDGPVSRVKIFDLTPARYVADLTLSEAHEFTVGAQYIAVGKRVKA